MSNNSVYTVTCDSTGKVVYPSNFTEANKINSGDSSNLEFYHDGIDSNKPGWNTDASGAKLRDMTGEIITADAAIVEIIPSTKLTNTLNIDNTDTSRNKIKGWYITYIKQLDDGRIELTLGTKQRTYADLSKEEMPTCDEYPYDIDNKEYLHIDIDALGLEVGDVLYMVNNNHIANALVVVETCDPGCGVIWCEWLPNYGFKLEEDRDNDFWNYSVWVCGSVKVDVDGTTINDYTVTNHTKKIDKGWVDLTPNSLNIGANNFAGGYGGVTIGDSNEVHDAFSMTVGVGNQIVGYGNFTSGRNSNVINGEYSIACGHSTSVNGSGRMQKLLKPGKTGANGDSDYDIFISGTGCAVFGRICSSNNDYGTLISGIRNSSYSSLCSAIFGRANTNNGHYSIIAGTNNKINKGESNAVFGSDNTITGPRCFALGQGLKGYPYQTIIGRYNEENADSKKVFIIGYGTSDSKRKNIFEVTNDGTVNVANRVFISNTTNGSTGGDLLIGASELKNLGDYQSSFTKDKIEIAKAYDYKYDENYEQINEIGKEYVKLTHNSLTLEAEQLDKASGGYNQDKVELNREGLVFTKQEGSQTCVLNPREFRLYNDRYDMFEVNSNGGSDPYHIKLTTDTKDVGNGELEITPTGISFTEVTRYEWDSPISDTLSIGYSYFKALEDRIKDLETSLKQLETSLKQLKDPQPNI